MLSMNLRLTDLNINFYDVFSLVIKWVQKRVYGNAKVFSLRLYENVPDESLLYYLGRPPECLKKTE